MADKDSSCIISEKVRRGNRTRLISRSKVGECCRGKRKTAGGYIWKYDNTGENSFGYIASWSKDKELKELRASLETINKTSCELINDIERNYKEICKERGIDLTAAPEPEQTPQQAVEEVSQPSAEYRETLLVLDDSTYLHVQPCNTGWDYALYDVVTMKQLDGPDLGRSEIISHLCRNWGWAASSFVFDK